MNDMEMLAPKAETAARKATKITEAVTAQVIEATEKASETTTTNLKDAQAKLAQGLHKAAGLARTAADAQRAAAETAVKAAKIYGAGVQNLATRAAGVNRTQFEATMAHFRTLAAVKSVPEAVELQATFARTALSHALTESSVLVEDYFKVAGQALSSVTAHVRETADRVATASSGTRI